MRKLLEGNFLGKYNIKQHPRTQTNYKKSFNDLEFWNRLIFKLETVLFIPIFHPKSRSSNF